MLGNLGVVQAYVRLPRAHGNLTRRFGGGSLLEWVIRRATDSTRLNGVIVVAHHSEKDAELRRLVPNDVPIFFSDDEDAIGRFSKALDVYDAEGVVRIRGDNPFVDPGLIDRLVTTAESHPQCDYVGYASQDCHPPLLAPTSIYAEWFRAAALRKAVRLATSTADREDVTHYLCSHPEKFNLRLIPAPANVDRNDVRLRIDDEEDWEHALAIYDALGPERFDLQHIGRFLSHQPALRKRMELLNRSRVEL